MSFVNIHEAKTTLSQLLLAVERGEEVTIARNGVAVARLVPVQPVLKREPGAWQSFPGWENYIYDPSVLEPLTEAEYMAEGWL